MPSSLLTVRRRFPAVSSLFLLLAAVGCGESSAPSLPEAEVRDSSGVRIVEYPASALEAVARDLQLAPEASLRIGVVEGASEYQFTRPLGAARLSDGSIAVVERTPAEIRIFDSEGAFVRRISRAGEGPGELTNPVAFTVTGGDTLVIWDARFQRASRFLPDGTFLDALTYRDLGGVQGARHVALGNRGTRLLFGPSEGAEELANRGPIRENLSVLPLGEDGAVGASLATLPGMERDVEMNSQGGNIVSIAIRGRWWWGASDVWPSESGAWFVDRFHYEAIHLDAEEGLDLRVRIAAPRPLFTPQVIDAVETEELLRATDPEQREFLVQDQATREYPEAAPALETVFADDAGRLWMGLTQLPPIRLPSGGMIAVREWVIFDREGGLIGRLDLPPLSRPFWADETGVLLLRNDELDVAYIEWYPFESR